MKVKDEIILTLQAGKGGDGCCESAARDFSGLP